MAGVPSRAIYARASLKHHPKAELVVRAFDTKMLPAAAEPTVAGECAAITHHADAFHGRVFDRVAFQALTCHALSAPEHVVFVTEVPAGDGEAGVALEDALVASHTRANRLRLSQRASFCAWLAAKTTGGCNG